MRKKRFFLVVIVIILATVLLSGCLKPPQQKDTGPKKALITSVKIKKGANDGKTTSAVEFMKSYLQTSFLDLKLAKKPGYKSEITTFFDDSITDKAVKDWQILTLGSEGKKLDSITKNNLKFKTISIYYDKLRNTSLSTVEFVFEAQYRADFNPVLLKLEGNFSLHQEKGNWKIFSYKLKQDLYLKRKHGTKS